MVGTADTVLFREVSLIQSFLYLSLLLWWPSLCSSRLNRISARVNVTRKTLFISMLVSYWKLKRQSRNGVPLIRRLQASRQGQRVNMYKVRKRGWVGKPPHELCDDVILFELVCVICVRSFTLDTY